MFNILIIEDNIEKLRDTLSVLEKVDGIDTDSIDHVVDSLGAKKKIKEKLYDLVIVDIAIPLRKSEVIDTEGGIKLIKEILQRKVYKIPSNIIGLTSYEEVFDKASEEFGKKILSVIRYSLSDDEWKLLLKDGVELMLQSKKSSLENTVDYDYDVAIINAVDTEFKAILNLSQSWKPIRLANDSSHYLETVFSKEDKNIRVIAACAPQMGMNACSVLSMKMIYNFRPRYLIMTGIAASVKDSSAHGFGDILIIDETWDGGAGKITQDESGNNIFLKSANHLRLESDVSERIRVYKDDRDLLRSIKDGFKNGEVPNTELSLHIGSVTSVAGVVENEVIINELKSKDRKLLGLEMESYGLYYSAKNCSNPKPIVLAIKSISDFANTNKNDKYQAYASYTSAVFMYHLIISEFF